MFEEEFEEEIKLAYSGNFIPLILKFMNDSELLICGHTYYLHELEVYLHSPEHRDEYTHKSSDQLIFGKWYVHKFKNGSYKNGTFKGLDIVCGNEGIYFGILIRAIRASNGDIIEGPSKTVDKILELTKCTLAELDNLNWDDLNDTLSISTFSSCMAYHIRHDAIYSGPRIGLSDKYPDWKDRHYRYVRKRQTKKQKRSLQVCNG